MRFLLDTNIVSEPTRLRPHSKVVSHLARHLPSAAIAAPTWFELQAGVFRLPMSKRRHQLKAFLDTLRNEGLPILPYDDRAAAWHAIEHARLVGVGSPCPLADGQIAAIAATNDLVLVTRNSKDFAAFSDLRLDNWFE
jgi:tRNA(fMet)-specific endonuclease VapC